MTKSKSPQLLLDVRLYRVGVRGYGDIQVQAPSPAAAKYRVFKLAREAGVFNQMRRFLARVTGVREVRR